MNRILRIKNIRERSPRLRAPASPALCTITRPKHSSAAVIRNNNWSNVSDSGARTNRDRAPFTTNARTGRAVTNAGNALSDAAPAPPISRGTATRDGHLLVP